MLQQRLEGLITTGQLRVLMPGRDPILVGRPTVRDPVERTIVVRDPRVARRVALDPELQLGEAYVRGDLTLEGGSLGDFLDFLGRNGAFDIDLGPPALNVARRFIQTWRTANGMRAARAHVAHHYDLSNALYRAFLDSDLQYSCAYFAEPGLTLEAAQQAKVQHILAKLQLRPGQTVLDIGCGWGGMALAIARAADVRVTGVTLSEEQLEVCRQRARQAGLEDRVDFALRDYRDVVGPFDRIVSVGMFEHVGPVNYPTFFNSLKRLLRPDGVALVHSIGRRSPPGRNSPWIEKYIFPGGYIPALSEVAGAIEPTGLWITDVEVLRLHYAETLRHWRERFLKNAGLVRDLYDDQFVRMWEFYLASSEMSFRYGSLMVLQVQLASQVGSLSITRDYMVDTERASLAPATTKRAARR